MKGNQKSGDYRQHAMLILGAASVFAYFLTVCRLQAATPDNALSSDQILARMADSNNVRQIAYSAVREYRLRNLRFDKEAIVSAQVSYSPAEGKNFVVLSRQGSPKLLEIVEKLLTSEVDASRPSKLADHEIGPGNYTAKVRSIDTIAGRPCYVVDLMPKHKTRYLIRGTAWVDDKSYEVVRLEGSTAARISMWISAAHIRQEFGLVDGVWLPTHTGAVTYSLLLGTCELEITYKDYLVRDFGRQVPVRGADLSQPPRP